MQFEVRGRGGDNANQISVSISLYKYEEKSTNTRVDKLGTEKTDEKSERSRSDEYPGCVISGQIPAVNRPGGRFAATEKRVA
jgi:hypothetical protein